MKINDLKFGVKLGGGFGIIIILALVIGLSSFTGLGKVVKATKVADNQNRLVKYVLKIRQEEKNFITRRKQQYADAVFAVLDKCRRERSRLFLNRR